MCYEFNLLLQRNSKYCENEWWLLISSKVYLLHVNLDLCMCVEAHRQTKGRSAKMWGRFAKRCHCNNAIPNIVNLKNATYFSILLSITYQSWLLACTKMYLVENRNDNFKSFTKKTSVDVSSYTISDK